MVHCRFSGEWWCPALPAVLALVGVETAGRYEGLGPTIRNSSRDLGPSGRQIDATQHIRLAERTVCRVISGGADAPG